MEPNMPQGNEQIVEQILSAVEQLLQAAGPEWTLEFIMAGIEQAGQGRHVFVGGNGMEAAVPCLRCGTEPCPTSLSS